MKVIVKDFLNVRVGKPSVNAPCYQYIAPGSELTVEDTLFDGDEYEGSTKWLRDNAGNYYWAGGVADFDVAARTPFEHESRFDEVLKSFPGNGTNIGVAFLDSGVNEQHIYLKNRIKYYESFIEGKSKTNIASHGNLVAGILGSDDPNVSRNKSDLYCFRTSYKTNSQVNRIDNYAVKTALEEIRDNITLKGKIKIINLSLDIIKQYIPLIQPIINTLYLNGMLVVVAAGENGISNNTKNLSNVIKVATFDINNFDSYKKNGFPIENCIYYLNIPIPSYSIEGNAIDDEINRDSAYCAFTSALIAKALSNNIAPENIQTYLSSISKSLKQESDPSPFTPYIS